MKNTSLVVLCVLLAFCSCRKKGQENTDVSFNNRLDKQVTLTIYPTMSDYSKGSNVVVRKTIKAGEIAGIPVSTLVSGRTYYMDWYTDDQVNTNWYNDNYPQPDAQVAFTSAEGKALYINNRLNSPARKVFLSNNDLSSSWRAVNAYLVSSSTGYISFWDKMSENEKYREMTVNKSFVAEYRYKDVTGGIVTMPLNFKVHRSDDAYIEFIDDNGIGQGSLATGKSPYGVPPDYKSKSRDTVMAYLPNSDYYFMMIRN